MIETQLRGIVFDSCKSIGIDFTACDRLMIDFAILECNVKNCIFSDLKLEKTRSYKARSLNPFE